MAGKRKKSWWRRRGEDAAEVGAEAAEGCCLLNALSVLALLGLAAVPLLLF